MSGPQYLEEYTKQLLDVSNNAVENIEGATSVYIRFHPEFSDSQSGFFYGKNTHSGKFESLPITDLTNYEKNERGYVGWFYEPMENQKATRMPPYHSENIDIEILSYVVPFYNDGKFI